MVSKNRKSGRRTSGKKSKKRLIKGANNNTNENLHNLLTNYISEDKHQINNRNQFIKLLEDFPQYCFGREINVPHFCGGGLLVDKSGEYILLAHHRKLDIIVGMGGHADGDNDLIRVATNETKEESGFDDIKLLINGVFDLDLQTCYYNNETHFHYELRFLFQTQQEAIIDGNIKHPTPPNVESKKLMWVHYKNDEIPTKRESMIRMFEKYRSFRDK